LLVLFVLGEGGKRRKDEGDNQQQRGLTRGIPCEQSVLHNDFFSSRWSGFVICLGDIRLSWQGRNASEKIVCRKSSLNRNHHHCHTYYSRFQRFFSDGITAALSASTITRVGRFRMAGSVREPRKVRQAKRDSHLIAAAKGANPQV